MDTPMISQAAHGRPFLTLGRKRALAIVLGLVALALIGYLVYRFWPGASGGSFLLTAEEAPAPAQLLSHGTLSLFTIDAAGEAALYDVARTDTRTYYLIGDSERSNLYRASDLGLEEMTHSDSLKMDLSVDGASGVAAYTVIEGQTSRIVVWSPLTEEETDLGAGLRPTLLPGGFFVVFEREGKLISTKIETGEEHELLVIPPGEPFAINTATLEVALYNPARSAIERYSIATMVAASFVSTVTVDRAPRELTYDTDLVEVYLDEMAGTAQVVRGDRVTDVPSLFLPLITGSYQLTVYHE